jgi:hypothetical protein
MRAVLTLVAAMMLGLAAGYAWSGMTPARARAPAVPRPKFDAAQVATSRPSELDGQWAARADDNGGVEAAASAEGTEAVEQSVHYAGCNEVRAAGKAPLHTGEPGYRPEMDGDGDRLACEPYHGN